MDSPRLAQGQLRLNTGQESLLPGESEVGGEDRPCSPPQVLSKVMATSYLRLYKFKF